MKNLTIFSIAIMFSYLSAAQGERAILINGSVLSIIGVDLQAEGYSVIGEKAWRDTSYLVKYDNSGNVQFAKAHPSSYLSGYPQLSLYPFQSLTDAGQGNYYLLTQTMDSLDQSNLFTIQKIDHSGNLVWEKFLARAAVNYNYDFNYKKHLLKTDSDGNIYFMTSLYSSIDLIKLAPTGDVLWSKNIVSDTVGNKNPGFDFKITSSGNIICTGKADYDILFLCFSPEGEVVWSKRYNDNKYSYSRAFKVVEMPNGNFFSFGLRQDYIPVSSKGFFIMETDTSGNILSYDQYMNLTDTVGWYPYSDTSPVFSPLEIYFNPDGSKTLIGSGFDDYLYIFFPMIIKMDADNNIIKSSRIGRYSSPFYQTTVAAPLDLKEDRLILVTSDDTTGDYYFAAGTVDNVPSCNIKPGTELVREPVTFNSGNITSALRIAESFGVTEGASSVMNVPLSAISHKSGCQSTTTIRETSTLNFEVYPNPVSGNLTIARNDRSICDANIFDISGKLNITRKISEEKQVIDVSALSAGIYLLMLKDERGHSSRINFVKE